MGRDTWGHEFGSSSIPFYGTARWIHNVLNVGNETVNLWQDGESVAAFTNVAVNVALGLGAAWLGYVLAHEIWR